MKFLSNVSEKIRLWHIAILLVLLMSLSAYTLRQNNLTMIELRDKVLEVDERTGDINKVEPHLEKLGNYVLTHMNTNLGTLELPGTFNTAVAKARKLAENSGSANSAIYAEAQQVCEDPFILLTARAQCIQDYVTSNALPGTDPREIEFPDKSLYTYSFASPLWSPDVAGFAVLASLLTLFVFALLILSRVVLPFFGRMIEQDPLE